MYYDDNDDFGDGAVARMRYHFCYFEEEEHTSISVFKWVVRVNRTFASVF